MATPPILGVAKNILIGGGSGFIGSHLAKQLKTKGHNVSIISRDAHKTMDEIDKVYTWDKIKSNGITISQRSKQKGLPKCDAVVNMTGTGLLDKRWSYERKLQLLNSRIEPTKIIVDSINALSEPPSVFVSGSATGIYPTTRENQALGGVVHNEYSKEVSQGFSGTLCNEWEKAANELTNPKTRLVIIRTAVVIDYDGGIVKLLKGFFESRAGFAFGDGKQLFPWISLKDEIGLIEHAINDETMQGVYLGAAPSSQFFTGVDFARYMAQAFRGRWWFNVPAWMIKLALGESAVVLTEGVRVYPKRTMMSGYVFQHKSFKETIEFGRERVEIHPLLKTKEGLEKELGGVQVEIKEATIDRDKKMMAVVEEEQIKQAEEEQKKQEAAEKGEKKEGSEKEEKENEEEEKEEEKKEKKEMESEEKEMENQKDSKKAKESEDKK